MNTAATDRPRILITGADGQLGWELQRTFAPLGNVFAFDRNGLDLASPDALRARCREINPALILNAAAYTAVDKAESEPELAMRINGEAPGVLAEEANRLGVPLIHYSTDYVFDGAANRPYRESDATGPQSAYGLSKLAGEHAVAAIASRHLILRTSWLYGNRRQNFFLTMLRQAAGARGLERRWEAGLGGGVGCRQSGGAAGGWEWGTWGSYHADARARGLRRSGCGRLRWRRKSGCGDGRNFGQHQDHVLWWSGQRNLCRRSHYRHSEYDRSSLCRGD